MDIPIQLIGGGTFAVQSVQTRALSDDPIEQLQLKLEQLSAVVMPAVVDRINANLPSGERIQAGFAALDTIANGEFDLKGGIASHSHFQPDLCGSVGERSTRDCYWGIPGSPDAADSSSQPSGVF